VFQHQHWFALGHFWSLAVEEHFYLVWPIVVSLLSRQRLFITCCGCATAALAVRIAMHSAGASSTGIYVFTPCRLDALALGGFLALAIRDPKQWLFLSKHAAWAAPALLAVIACGFAMQNSPEHSTPFMTTVGPSLLALMSGAYVVLAIRSSPSSLLGRALCSKCLLKLGKYSYGLYVFHRLLLVPVRRVVKVDRLADLTGSPILAMLLFYGLALAASLVVAVAIWHLYEARFLRLKRYFV
jgi:peptidoglycan/LPS O-acetylase OafA/YrhL